MYAAFSACEACTALQGRQARPCRGGMHGRDCDASRPVLQGATKCHLGEATGLDGDALVRTSRLCAKVDGNAVQDGFQLYQHNFILSDEGDWAVVQQGMNTQSRTARRYHWCSSELTSFVEEPHTGVTGENRGLLLNLTDREAGKTIRPVHEVLQLMAELTKDRRFAEIQLPPGSAEGGTNMCEVLDRYWNNGVAKGLAAGREEGLAEGMEKGLAAGMEKGLIDGIVTSLKNLIANTGMSPAQAMAALGIMESERDKYASLLTS